MRRLAARDLGLARTVSVECCMKKTRVVINQTVLRRSAVRESGSAVRIEAKLTKPVYDMRHGDDGKKSVISESVGVP